MPMNSLPTAILAHMVAVNNVPPPPLRNIPGLKPNKTINYGQLNALCHIRGLQSSRHSSLNLTAHNTFIKQYPQIFSHEKSVFPKIFQQDEKRKCCGKTEEKKPEHDYSHNISVYVRQARGGPILHEEERATLKFIQFLDILKKLYYEAVLKNSTGPWSVWGSKSHSYTWEVFILVSLACDQKNPGHDPDRAEHRLCNVWEIRPLNIQFTNL